MLSTLDSDAMESSKVSASVPSILLVFEIFDVYGKEFKGYQAGMKMKMKKMGYRIVRT